MELKKEPLNKAIKDYVEGYSLEAGLSPKTVDGKAQTLARVASFLAGRPLNVHTARAYCEQLRLHGWSDPLHRRPAMPWQISSVKVEIKVLKAFSNFLFKRKYITENWGQELVTPKVPKKPFEVLPLDVAEQVVVAGTTFGSGDRAKSKRSKVEHRLALRFILRTGLRLGELLSLRGQDLNIEEGTFFVKSKGGDVDVAPLPRDMIPDLKPRVDRDRVFLVDDQTLNLILKRGCRSLGITKRLTVHGLRHAFCTGLLKNGVPMQIVSRLMRHSSVRITDAVYTHYLIEDLKYTINSAHPLVRGGLSQDEVFETIEQAVERTGVKKDQRFRVTAERSGAGLTINVTPASP